MKNYQKIVACVLAVTISAGTTGFYAYHQKKNSTFINTSAVVTEVIDTESVARVATNGDMFKDETVYVLCNSDASIRDIIVSDWLKNPMAESNISDISNLSNIENVKGDEIFSSNGSDLTWNANGNDIYYKGHATDELPVTVNVKYLLDGVEYSLDDMKGKSGHLVIEWKYYNNQVITRNVNGEDVTMYVPFMTASTAILNTDIFSNVEVTNGKVISDGEKLIVAGMAFPGLSQSLGLDEKEDLDIEIPESFTIEADVVNFSMDSS